MKEVAGFSVYAVGYVLNRMKFNLYDNYVESVVRRSKDNKGRSGLVAAAGIKRRFTLPSKFPALSCHQV